MTIAPTPMHIDLLGDIALLKDGVPVNLPKSRKSRALLAYLVATAHPHRRDRLCDVFFDVADDPRGALRWSLSKLRAAINEPGAERLKADRERVSVDAIAMTTDIGEIRKYLSLPDSSSTSLEKALRLLSERPFLGGLDGAGTDIFDAWLAAEREGIRRLQARTIARLIEHEDTPPNRALTYAQSWLEEDPYSSDAASAVIEALRNTGDHERARRREVELRAHFKASGMEWRMPPHVRGKPSQPLELYPAARRQDIRFCRTSDGVSIAYASIGSGTPLVKAANWLSHLEHDWNAPIWSPLFRKLAEKHRFIRYDERGNGLSDWDVDTLTQETFVTDLEAVVEAAGVERFALLGISQGAAVAIDFAVRHPDCVSRLVLFGGYPAGWRIDATPETLAEREAIITLTRSGWGREDPAYRHLFSTTFMPGASSDQLAWFDEFQRLTTSPDNAARFLSAFGDIDVRDKLASIEAPTLILHSRGDRRIPWSTARDLASQIPNARFVTLDSPNHLLLEDEAAAAKFVAEIERFLE